ncbi:olfactory receptor 1361-like [Meles meles]|uniref:olfactory receptor 1361-like n=1 Tax=Meles meles TaxID=9662 RepID=UPI001E69B9CD|nr:olfactory receptor 1361-like [Meles meles]
MTSLANPISTLEVSETEAGQHVQEIRNHTSVSNFLLLGFSDHPHQQPLLFGLFLGMYLVTVLGNLLIILATVSNQHLHTPMYFFLANLSFIDTCFSCTIVPKVLVNTLTQHHTITYTGCLIQMYFFMALALLDDFLLAVMAYDRYVAICLPLHYTTIMCPQRCLLLVASSWLCAHLLAFSLTLLMAQFSFCASHSIPHFFCDLLPVLKLACSDTQIFQVMMFAEAALAGVVPLACVLVSYAHIMHTILRVSSAGGKHKLFSTCGSHLTVVTLFYGTVFLVYFQPSSSYSAGTGMMASVVYTMVTPMLNPFIYSLRNRDMKGALWRLLTINVHTVHHNLLSSQNALVSAFMRKCCATDRYPHPLAGIVEVCRERCLTGAQSLGGPEGLNSTLFSQAYVLENGFHCGKSGRSYVRRIGSTGGHELSVTSSTTPPLGRGLTVPQVLQSRSVP